MDRSIERMIEGLEAKFDALLARDEEEAADDLAGSLDRGVAIHERLSLGNRALEILLPGGGHRPVHVIGCEHVCCGSPIELIAAIGWTVVAQKPGTPPSVTDATLAQALAPWAEGRRRVEVCLGGGTASYRGSLVLVAPDHVILERAGADLVVPLERVGSVRLVREG